MEETCYYCGTAPASPPSSHPCPMYRESGGRLFTRVEKTVVAVPRCRACACLHRRYTSMGYALSGTVVVPAALGVIGLNRPMSLWNLLGAMGAASILAVVGGEFLNRFWLERAVLPRKHSIKSRNNVHRADVVRQMQLKGWRLKDPTPP